MGAGTAPAPPPAAPAYKPLNTGIVLKPYVPTWADRLRGMVANSAIGHAIEAEAPRLVDKLGLRPTETVNSPTYEADRSQILAPQYLAPSPTSHVGHVVRGVLTGAGQLTSGKNLATATAIAATGGVAAPFAPAAVGVANAGLFGMGAKGMYDEGKNAYSLYGDGRTDEALEAAGAALPNAALMLPGAAKPMELVGDRLQGAGVDLMDSYLKAGKKAYKYGAEPGKAVLQEGPGTSVGLTRQGMADQVEAAKNRVGASIPAIVDASSASVPRSTLRAGANGVIQAKKAVLGGFGGDVSGIQPLDDLHSTFTGLFDKPGDASAAEVYAAKRNLDDNINWGRDLDPKDATVNNARREIRSGISGTLYGAVPELEAPSQQYGSLASASKLAGDRTFDSNGSVFSPLRTAAAVTSGVLAGGASHNPTVGVGTGLLTGVLPEIAKAPIVKTGGATALYQGGRVLSAAGRALAGSLPALVGAPDKQEPSYSGDAQANESHQPANNVVTQGNPSSGRYRRTDIAPEIIRPGDMSRSQMGVGLRGRDGMLIRPLARLSAPAAPMSKATPYVFDPKGIQAIPRMSSESLARSIGTAAHTVPGSVLKDVLPMALESDQAAALRRARVGSMAHIAPLRSFQKPKGGN